MNKVRQASINLIFLVITLIINYMGAVGMISGLSQKDISDQFMTLITPSPATFSIWGLIYSLLIISLVVTIVKKDDPYYQRAVTDISLLFRVSCILNISWIVLFSFVQLELSVLFILGMLLTMTFICQQLPKIHERKRWFLPLTFGLYTGWLFIASVVNIAAMLVKLEWNGFGLADNIWTSIILIVAIGLNIFVLSRIRNAVFPLPVAWAYLGIYQFLNSPAGFNGAYPLLQWIALGGMAVLIGVAAVQLYRNHFSILPSQQ